MPRRTLPLFALTLAALPACSDGLPLDAEDDAFCERALAASESVDAFAWLKDPYGGPKHLGEWSTEEGLAFAHKLEERGARRVVAVGVRRGASAEEGQSAGGLVVELPPEPPRRLALFRLYAAQVRKEGYVPQADRGQKYLFLPWEK